MTGEADRRRRAHRGFRRAAALLALLALAGLAACGSGDDGAVPAVPRGARPEGPSALASELLDAHNDVRESPSPAPSPPLGWLSWSTPVAAAAEAWADGCSFSHDPTLRALGHGQNLAWSAPAGAHSAADIVALWAAEATDYAYATNTCAPGRQCGHYTQIVWRGTTQLGCARRTCAPPSPAGSAATWDLWVCNYAPPGNWIGQRPY